MTMKTPEQIATDQMGAFTVHDGDVDEMSADFIKDQIQEAIETDREQRDTDGVQPEKVAQDAAWRLWFTSKTRKKQFTQAQFAGWMEIAIKNYIRKSGGVA